MESNIITINGNVLTFEHGQTILEVARLNAIDIPTLCHLKNTVPTGACKICVVELSGSAELVESCATKAENGMVVLTQSPKVTQERKKNISRMLASGNHNCAIRDFASHDWTSF